MVARRPSSRTLHRRISNLLHPVFRRAPVEGTVGLRNSASCDPVRERGDQVFGERNRATADGDHFPNDDFFPDLGNLFLNDMGDNVNANSSGSAPAVQYVFLSVLYEMFLQFVCLAVAIDRRISYKTTICFTIEEQSLCGPFDLLHGSPRVWSVVSRLSPGAFVVDVSLTALISLRSSFSF